MFIVFEWLDGSGKDTQLRLFFEYLTKKYKYLQIWKTQEPSWISESGKLISHKLKNEWFESPEEALELYIKDRVEMNHFKTFMSNNGVILSSRWDYTTYAYQSIKLWQKEWFTFEKINEKHKELFTMYNKFDNEKFLIPDLTFYFQLPIEETMNRINNRLAKNETKDFFEKKDFLEKAWIQYLKSIEFLEKKENRKIIKIDAVNDIVYIHNLVVNSFEKYIEENNIKI